MKYILIGCGRIAHCHIDAAKANGLDIVALCDIDISKAQEAKIKFELPDSVKCYSDYKEALKIEKPELAAIATESGKHAAIAIDCINSLCNVIIEKPIALSLSDADEIIRLSQEKHVKVAANHQNRFNKSIQRIRDALNAGRFGKMYYGAASIRWKRDENYYKSASWRGTWELDGGVLMNQSIHTIDLLRWMMGDEIVEVSGMTARLKQSIEAEDLGLATIKFANGGYGVIDATTNVFGGDTEGSLTLFGEKGRVKAGGTATNRIDDWMFEDESELSEEERSQFNETPPNVYGFGHTSLYTDMIEAIKNDTVPYADAYAGRRALELILAIYKSSAEGKPVKLPLDSSVSTMDFKGMFD